MRIGRWTHWFLAWGLGPPLAAQSPASTNIVLGDCPVLRGGALPECRLSYRIYGSLNRERSNAVLLPTWFNGTAGAWQGLLGVDGYVDTTRFAAIAVDAFGAGGSSSPSDSSWRGRAFPETGIAEMVMAQRTLVREHLGITRLHAVVGISMGGMQAFEWGVRYPTEVDRVVSIEGSPRLTAYDRILWEALVAPLQAFQGGRIPRDSAYHQIARLFLLGGTTPVAVNARAADSVPLIVAAQARGLGNRPAENMLLQLRAMIGHDVAKATGGDMHAAYRAFRPRLLVVASPDDHAVTAQSALDFARQVRGDTLVMASRCGHQIFICERSQISASVRAFLMR